MKGALGRIEGEEGELQVCFSRDSKDHFTDIAVRTGAPRLQV